VSDDLVGQIGPDDNRIVLGGYEEHFRYGKLSLHDAYIVQVVFHGGEENKSTCASMVWSVYGSDIREGEYNEDGFRLRLEFLDVEGCVPLHLTGNYLDEFDIEFVEERLRIAYTVNPDYERRELHCARLAVQMFETIDGETFESQPVF